MNLAAVLRSDRKTLVVAIDHGMTLGNMEGVGDPLALLKEFQRAGVDGTLLSPGFAKQYGAWCRQNGLSYSVTMDFQLWSNRPGLNESIRAVNLVTSVARAKDLGASAVKMLFLWGLDDALVHRNIELITQAAEQAHALQMPLMLEPLWFGTALAPADHDQVIVHGARMAVELGADILKIPPVGVPALEQILIWNIPTVFLGGAKQDDPQELMRRIRLGLQAGARGVVIGRNVWQSPRMHEVISQIQQFL